MQILMLIVWVNKREKKFYGQENTRVREVLLCKSLWKFSNALLPANVCPFLEELQLLEGAP